MRLARAEDIDSVVTLVNRCYRGEESKKGWTSEADFLGGQRIDQPMLQELLMDPLVSLLLWHDEEKANLVAACECRYFPEEKTVELGMISVSPDLQGAGLGKVVLKEAEVFAREELQAKSSRMWVISLRESLIQWYQRRGYKLSGQQKPFPMNDPRFGLPKVDHLEFLELIKVLG